jgi:hypothetical protein
MVECSGGQAIHQLTAARLYFNPITGGGWRAVQEHSAVGREGQPDSFVVDSGPGGHYYITAINAIGESCASGSVYVPGWVTTGVEPTEEAVHVTSVRVFDISGRPIRGPTASGIYFRRTTYSDGSSRVQKFVHLK